MRHRVWLQWRHFNGGVSVVNMRWLRKILRRKPCARLRCKLPWACLWVVWSRACQDLVTVKDETRGAKRASSHGTFSPPLPNGRNWLWENSTPFQSFYAPFLFSSPGFVVGKLAPNNFNFPNLEHQIYGKQYQMETFQSFAVLLSLKNISTTLHVFISLPNPRCRNLVVV